MAIEFSEEIPSLRTTMENILAVVQPDKLRAQIAELNEKAAAPDLWDDPSAAQAVTSALSHRQSELDRVTQMGLENPRLFALTRTALSSLGRVDHAQVPAVCAAHLLKTLAFAGLRPSLDVCVSCGRDVEAVPESGLMALSYQEGGAVCAACRSSVETVLVPASTVAWCRALLSSTFAEFSVLRFCQQWVSEHGGANLKSLNFLFTCGLF